MATDPNSQWLHRCLITIVFLLAVIAVELSVLIGPIQPRAQAQIPDSGEQRMRQLDAQNRANALLDDILQHLRTQPVKVRLVGTDKETKPESREAVRPSGRPRQ